MKSIFTHYDIYFNVSLLTSSKNKHRILLMEYFLTGSIKRELLSYTSYTWESYDTQFIIY